MKYIIGNWKAHVIDVPQWFDIFSQNYTPSADVSVIICPSFLDIEKAHHLSKTLENVYIAAQDISRFPEGAYTGEVNGSQLAPFCTHVLIGHSERKHHLNESVDIIQEKIKQAHNLKLKTIVCIEENETPVENADLLAFEPFTSISTNGAANKSATLDSILAIKNKFTITKPYIYGGSVSIENADIYISHPEIDGVLIGGESINANHFAEIIQLYNS